MNYKEVLEFMFAQLPMYQRIGTSAFKKDLTNIRLFAKELGNPHIGFYDSIHIAGTNGKGSTAHMMAAIYQTAGFKVGLYTSPHYKDFRERIKINGNMISKREVIDFVSKNKATIQQIKPSFFEMSVALALDIFRSHKVDLAIIETGLGGRLDSTNIVTPLCSVITNIGLDHQNMLGESLKDIAGEKAGIIKQNVPVVVGSHQSETDQIFIKKSAELDSQICFASDRYDMEISELGIENQLIEFTDRKAQSSFTCDLPSGIQYNSVNARTALTTIDIVNEISSKYQVQRETALSGLENFGSISKYIGRWFIKSRAPLIILDAAHNVDGMTEVLRRLKKIKGDQIHVVFGTVKDKPLDSIFQLLPKQYKYYFARPNVRRGLETKNLSELANNFGLRSKAYVSCRNALRAAKRTAKKDDLILVTGSTFVVAEII